MWTMFGVNEPLPCTCRYIHEDTSMCVCVCECMYVCMCVHVSACVHVCVCVCVFVRVCVQKIE